MLPCQCAGPKKPSGLDISKWLLVDEVCSGWILFTSMHFGVPNTRRSLPGGEKQAVQVLNNIGRQPNGRKKFRNKR